MYFDLFKEAWASGPLYPKACVGFVVLLLVGLLVFVILEDKIDI
jgi:hypothetical protein